METSLFLFFTDELAKQAGLPGKFSATPAVKAIGSASKALSRPLTTSPASNAVSFGKHTSALPSATSGPLAKGVGMGQAGPKLGPMPLLTPPVTAR